MLTRHIGVIIAATVGVHLFLQKRILNGLTAMITASICLLPWLAWLASVRQNTQAELLMRPGLFARVTSQGLFYLQRLPDQLTGPVVEVGTVFTRSTTLSTLVMIWATFATSVLLYGWLRSIHTRRGLSGLIGFFALALLLVWPFTEAGRFLIPLVPCLLIGALEGLAPLIWRVGRIVLHRDPQIPDLGGDSYDPDCQPTAGRDSKLSRAGHDLAHGAELSESSNYLPARLRRDRWRLGSSCGVFGIPRRLQPR